MEASGWRAAGQGEAPAGGCADAPAADWKAQFSQESRQKVVKTIMETLKRKLPVPITDGLTGLQKIAVLFEERCYIAAISQNDYLRKISLKLLSLEPKPEPNAPKNLSMPNTTVVKQSLANPASLGNQGHSSTMPMINQPLAPQAFLVQKLQNNSSSAVQSTASLPPALSSITGNSQSTITGQTSNLQSMPSKSQSSVSNFAGQGPPADIYSNAQRQLQGGQHQQQIISQQQQQSQDQLIYQKMQHPSLLQPHMQQQQSPLQPTRLQSSQQSVMQTSSSLQSDQSTIQQTQLVSMQSTLQPGFQQNPLNSLQQSVSSLLQQNSQSVARQQQQTQPSIHHQMTSLQQQPTSVTHQSSLPPQEEQQHLMGQQANVSNMKQAQQLWLQNIVPDIQQQQLQRMPVQQSNLLSMQQPQQTLNQQTVSLHHHHQLGPQSNISGMQQQQQQQQQLLGSPNSVSSMQPHQSLMHVQQQPKTTGQQQLQTQPTSLGLLHPQSQQSQHQSSEQQFITQFQSQSTQLQQQLPMQQQPHSLQRDMQQKLPASGALLQSQNAIEQQNQFVQAQRELPYVSPSTSVGSTAQTGHSGVVDWQEDTYQKLKSMKEQYYADLNELYQKISLRLQQRDAFIPSAKPSEYYEKMKGFKLNLERMLTLLQLPKSNMQPHLKDKLPMYEEQIVTVLVSNKCKKALSSRTHGQQQFQHPGGHGHSMPQQQPSQVSLLQQHDNHEGKVQQINLQGSTVALQKDAPPSMQHGSMPLSTHSGVPTAQQNIRNVIDSTQGSSFSSLQKGVIGSMQQGGMGCLQNAISGPQQTTANALLQSSKNTLQPNVSPTQTSSDAVQQHHLNKLQQEQHHSRMQTQQMNQQLRQCHLQQQLIQQEQKQQLLQPQQLLEPQKQQQTGQMPLHQKPLLHQTSEVDEFKETQASSIKQGLHQQQYSAGQPSNYHHKQGESGFSFPLSLQQDQQTLSPQVSIDSSPHNDQHSLVPSQLNTGTPLQSTSSPFVPSPSTLLAPSPVPGDSGKQLSGISSLTNDSHIGHQPTVTAPLQVQPFAVSTPGISASPLLEFTSQDGHQANVATPVPNKRSATEQPMDRLVEVVLSSTSKALSSSISDMGSVVSILDRIADSAPGNGSRAAVGEDLVAMTQRRLQARSLMSQEGSSTTQKIKRNTSAMPLNYVSSAHSVNDCFKQSYGPNTSELESTATSRIKRHKIGVSHELMEEIREINQQLIDTVVNISEEDADSNAAASESREGTVIKCCFTPVALCPSLKSQFTSAQMCPILPLRLLVPANYPKSSPVLLDQLPDEPRESDDLSIKAKSRFRLSLRGLSQPMSLGEMARIWDACAHKVIAEYAQKTGGGSFSSRYGAWENCVGA